MTWGTQLWQAAAARAGYEGAWHTDAGIRFDLVVVMSAASSSSSASPSARQSRVLLPQAIAAPCCSRSCCCCCMYIAYADFDLRAATTKTTTATITRQSCTTN